MRSSTVNSANGSSSRPRSLALRWMLGALPWVSLAVLIAGFLPPPGCMIRSVTGLACPSCGTWTALRSVQQGNFARAFAANPLFPYWFFLFGLLFLQASLSLSRSAWSPGRDYLQFVARSNTVIALHVAAFILAALYKNFLP